MSRKVEGYMINYKPLLSILERRNITYKQLQEDLKISSRTLAKLRKNEFLSIKTLITLCAYLDVKIEDVIKIDYSVAYKDIVELKQSEDVKWDRHQHRKEAVTN